MTGAVVSKNGKSITGKLGMPQYEIDEQKAEALRGDWDRVRGTWESWKSANDRLAELLVEQCRSALGEAKEVSD